MDKLKLIKTIVALLTFLLVFGMLTTIGAIYKKVSSSAPKLEGLNLNQPQGSNIEHFQQEEGKIFMLIKNGGKSDRIIIVNTNKPSEKPVEIELY